MNGDIKSSQIHLEVPCTIVIRAVDERQDRPESATESYCVVVVVVVGT